MRLRRPWSLDLDSIKVGNLGRACLVLHVYAEGRDTVLLADIRGEEFVRIDMPPGVLVRLLSLSCDGTAIALWIRRPDQYEAHLVHINLATGEQCAFDGYQDGTLVAYAPEGTSLAAVHIGDGDDRIELSIIGVKDGVRSRFHIDEIEFLGDGAASWSPDGQLLAFECHLNEDTSAVAVVRPQSGELVRLHEGVGLLASSNGNWLGTQTLLLVDENIDQHLSPFKALDVRSGAMSRVDGLHDRTGVIRAVAGRDFISVASGDSGVRSIRLGRLGEQALREIVRSW